jgi:hypothetical protein
MYIHCHKRQDKMYRIHSFTSTPNLLIHSVVHQFYESNPLITAICNIPRQRNEKCSLTRFLLREISAARGVICVSPEWELRSQALVECRHCTSEYRKCSPGCQLCAVLCVKLASLDPGGVHCARCIHWMLAVFRPECELGTRKFQLCAIECGLFNSDCLLCAPLSVSCPSLSVSYMHSWVSIMCEPELKLCTPACKPCAALRVSCAP